MKRYACLTLMLLIAVTMNTIAQSKAQTGTTDAHSSQATSFVAEPIQLETPTATLYGTLERPQSTARVPLVLFISGSGPTDRDGNSPLLKGPNNSTKMLAEGLAAAGIASVRYDKRLVGESGKGMQLAAQKAGVKLREDDLRFESYVEDAILWCKKLRADNRFTSLIVVGHSEGSLIGMVAAHRAGADAFVSVAGSGRPAQQILLEQLKGQLPADLFKSTEEILSQLAAGQTVGTVPSSLNFLFRPSVQPYMISWLHYDPAKEIALLSSPVLIVQGTTDIQVSLQDAKLLSGAKPSAKSVVVDGMNHVLKMVPSDHDKQVASYSDPSLPVAPRLVAELIRFVKSVKEERPSDR